MERLTAGVPFDFTPVSSPGYSRFPPQVVTPQQASEAFCAQFGPEFALSILFGVWMELISTMS